MEEDEITETSGKPRGGSLHMAVYWLAAVAALVWPIVRPGVVPLPAAAIVVVPLLLVARHLDHALGRRRSLELTSSLSRDALTGLPNRQLFMRRLGDCLEEPLKRTQFTAVMYLDVDRFKAINDTLGHTVGDRFLVKVAERLKACTPSNAFVARLAGDEFTILLPAVDSRDAVVRTAEKILASFAETVRINGHAVWAGMSIGIVMAGPPRPRADDLLGMADSALYQAKLQGKGRFVLFEPNQPTPTLRNLPLEVDLRAAPSTNQLVVHFQPMVNLADLKVTGFEALIRWQHPQLGLLGPSEFIHLAEETGLIHELGDWIVRRACNCISTWQKMYGQEMTVSINLSALQFRQREILAQIRETIDLAGLAPRWVQLEITETVLLQDDDTTMQNLRGLRDMGLTVAIDDFGIGYSSLNYLKLFDVDILKIDQSFVQGIDDPRTLSLTKAMCQLGHTLGLTVIAEGIETREQLDAVREIDCDLGQGFLLGKPMDESEVNDLLVRGGLQVPRSLVA